LQSLQNTHLSLMPNIPLLAISLIVTLSKRLQLIFFNSILINTFCDVTHAGSCDFSSFFFINTFGLFITFNRLFITCSPRFVKSNWNLIVLRLLLPQIKSQQSMKLIAAILYITTSLNGLRLALLRFIFNQLNRFLLQIQANLDLYSIFSAPRCGIMKLDQRGEFLCEKTLLI
jgi:hypothetical protein